MRVLLAWVLLSASCLGMVEMPDPDAPSHGLLSHAEWERIRWSETIVVGEVRSIEERPILRGGHCTAVSIAVETCVKGECGGESVTTGMLQARGVTFPEVGHRYIFFLRWFPDAPEMSWGGYDSERYELDDWVVLRDETPSLDTFLDAIRTAVAERSPEVLLESSDAAVVGTVTEYVYEYGLPSDAFRRQAGVSDPRGVSGQEIARWRAGEIDPAAFNFVEVVVEEVLKGPLAPGDSLTIVLPYQIGSGYDVPRFEHGEHVLVFARRSDDGYWRLCAGTDSKVIVRPDGSIGEYGLLSDLAARAHN